MALELNERIEAVKLNYIALLKSLNEQKDLVAQLKKNFPDQTLNVVMIGHGAEPIEINALEEFLKPHGLELKFYGFEIEEKDVLKCKSKYVGADYHFYDINAAKYQQVLEKMASERAHIVIARHPVFNLNHRDIANPFHYVFTQTIPYILHEHGCLLVSIFTEPEYKFCQDLLRVTHMGDFNHAEYAGVYWETEKTSVKYGVDSYLGKEVDLYAEKYFLSVVDYQPALLLSKEKLMLDAENTFASFKDRYQDFFKDSYQGLIAQITSKFFDVVNIYKESSNKKDCVFIKFYHELIQYFSHEVVSVSPTDIMHHFSNIFESMKKNVPEDIVEEQFSVWYFSRYGEHVDLQEQLLKNLLESFLLLAIDKEFKSETGSVREQQFVKAGNIVLQGRPLDKLKVKQEEIVVHKPLSEQTAEEQKQQQSMVNWWM